MSKDRLSLISEGPSDWEYTMAYSDFKTKQHYNDIIERQTSDKPVMKCYKNTLEPVLKDNDVTNSKFKTYIMLTIGGALLLTLYKFFK